MFAGNTLTLTNYTLAGRWKMSQLEGNVYIHAGKRWKVGGGGRVLQVKVNYLYSGRRGEGD